MRFLLPLFVFVLGLWPGFYLQLAIGTLPALVIFMVLFGLSMWWAGEEI